MSQRHLILTVVAVGLVAAALWALRESAEDADKTVPVQAQAPATPFGPSSTHVASSEPAAAPAPVAVPPPPAPAAAVDPIPAAPEASEPVDVDTPEPAERKFARGGRPEPDQN